jgi:mRNA-degrading endonuclease RelE of RelBE toxin-antitoxin system
MGYELYLEDTFLKSIEKFPLAIRSVIFSKIDFLKDDPNHPSLRTEKLYKGTKDETRASSINMGIRLIWKLNGNEIKIIDVGGHDIYRKYKFKRKSQ